MQLQRYDGDCAEIGQQRKDHNRKESLEMKNQKTEQKQRYGLLTAITLITGTVIGSGIFFKAPKVLDATNGSVPLGILMFAMAALAIIFGSLAIGQIAARTDKPGGIMTYYEEFISPRVACSYGWFEVFIHYPAIIAVLSWIAGVYFCTLFNIEGSLLLQCGIGTAWILICFAFNALSRKGGGYFQNASTFIKMIPLLLVAFFGLILGDPITALKARPLASNSASGLLAAVGPLCFAYDGWHVATFVQADIKNPKRNMPLALFLTPIVITIVYICYFWGMSSILGPQRVMELGDAHVAVAMEKILGALGGRVFFIFVIISVMGAVNGQVMGICRTPYALSLRNMFPAAKKFSVMNKAEMPINSCLLGMVISLVWMVIHYICQSTGVLGNSDVSEIAIMSSYLLYLPLYYVVFRLWRQKEIKSLFMGLFVPVLAVLGSAIAILGGLQNPLFIWYLLICAAMLLIAFFYYGRHKDDIRSV